MITAHEPRGRHWQETEPHTTMPFTRGGVFLWSRHEVNQDHGFSQVSFSAKVWVVQYAIQYGELWS